MDSDIIEGILRQVESGCTTERERRLAACVRYFVERDRQTNWRLRVLGVCLYVGLAVNGLIVLANLARCLW